MSRFARERRVFFVEEPEFGASAPQWREYVCEKTGVRVCTPLLPHGLDRNQMLNAQRDLLGELLSRHAAQNLIAWYYTPMAREFSSHLEPTVTVYDCMDELSAFAGAPPEMHVNEASLFGAADLVFTGGVSLYESKRQQHRAVYAFPSSVEIGHFARARKHDGDPADQADIPHPRIGYAGVIDERMDLDLLRRVSELRPDWHFVLVGPTCKIDPASLPQAPNLHYLGMKPYADLPKYFSGWDAGMLPFALNDSTRFISPTKTPEYLAAGLRVISSRIRDVVRPYGDKNLVAIYDNAQDFVAKAEQLLKEGFTEAFRTDVDAFLATSSWDKTWLEMKTLIERAAAANLRDAADFEFQERAAYV